MNKIECTFREVPTVFRKTLSASVSLSFVGATKRWMGSENVSLPPPCCAPNVPPQGSRVIGDCSIDVHHQETQSREGHIVGMYCE